MKDQVPRKREWPKIFTFWRHAKDHSQEFKPRPHDDHALVLSVNKKALPPVWRQFRFIGRVFSRREWRLFWLCLLGTLVTLGIGAADLLRPHIAPVPASGGIITEALVGSPKLINPIYATMNDVDRDLTTLIFAGLFRLDQNLEPQPDLAESFQWLDNRKTLEVKIRADALFHDGEPVTSDDVVFTFQSLMDPTWRSPLLKAYRSIKVIRVDDRTVQFQLEKPDPQFLPALTLGLLPAHAWEDVTGATAPLAEANLRPIGAGPYKVSSFTRDSKGSILSFALKSFDGYRGPKPYIQEWHFRFYADHSQAVTALQNRQVDTLAFVPWGEVSSLKDATIGTINLDLPQETVAYFNVKDALLKDARLRKALSLAIDPVELRDLVGHAANVLTPFPFLEKTASTSSWTDLEGARTILSSMNWVIKEGDDVRTLAKPVNPKQKPSATSASSTQLAFTIDVPDQPDLLQVAQYLKRRWSLLGAKTDIRVSDPETLLQKATDDRTSYQIIVFNTLLSPTQDLAPFWSSQATVDRGLNLSNLADRDIDTALDAVSSASSTEAVTAARLALSKTIMDQYPALFLLRPSYAYLISDHVHGAADQRISQPSDRLLNSWHWYVKTGWKWN